MASVCAYPPFHHMPVILTPQRIKRDDQTWAHKCHSTPTPTGYVGKNDVLQRHTYVKLQVFRGPPPRQPEWWERGHQPAGPGRGVGPPLAGVGLWASRFPWAPTGSRRIRWRSRRPQNSSTMKEFRTHTIYIYMHIYMYIFIYIYTYEYIYVHIIYVYHMSVHRTLCIYVYIL